MRAFGLAGDSGTHAYRVCGRKAGFDCGDHDSMNMLKRVCERGHIAWHPLRTASVASFIELIGRLNADAQTNTQSGGAPRFCLRHG
ncbi:hypothetical protein ATN79_25895 [Paraburkholderia caribensis]|nr:hypothetical protein ATN79_25895 [Paraburkholderia caribensis]